MCFVLKEKGKQNLENGKGFPLFPLCLGLGPTPSPPAARIPPFPFFSLLRPSASSARLAAQRDSQRAPPLPFAAVADKAVPRAVPLPGGTHLSDLSSTQCLSRTRAATESRARFARGVPISPDFLPLNTDPKLR